MQKMKFNASKSTTTIINAYCIVIKPEGFLPSSSSTHFPRKKTLLYAVSTLQKWSSLHMGNNGGKERKGSDFFRTQ